MSLKLVLLIAVIASFLAVIAKRSTSPEQVQAAEEQAVIATLRLQSDSDVKRIQALEDQLAAAIKNANVGEFDGDEFGKGECVLYMYGPSAESLFKVVFPILNEFKGADGSFVVKRFGKPGAKQEKIALASR
jgi:hypothetical protein